jgi:hypothetical protein
LIDWVAFDITWLSGFRPHVIYIPKQFPPCIPLQRHLPLEVDYISRLYFFGCIRLIDPLRQYFSGQLNEALFFQFSRGLIVACDVINCKMPTSTVMLASAPSEP